MRLIHRAVALLTSDAARSLPRKQKWGLFKLA